MTAFVFPSCAQAETIYTTKTLYSVADIWVSNLHASENGGDDASISIGWFGAELRRGLVKFDLSEIPSNATITSASFNLYMIQTETGCNGTPSPNQLIIGQNTSDWAEGTTGWSSKPVYSTWLSYSSPACPAHWYYMSATSIVRNWIGGQPNYGFQIVGPDGGDTYYRNFNTRESASSWARPQLVISYSYPRTDDPSPVPAPADPAPSSPADPQPDSSQSANTTSNPSVNSSNPASSTASNTGVTSNNTSPSSPSGSMDTVTAEDKASSALPATAEINTKEGLVGLVGQMAKKDPQKWPYTLNMLQRRLLVGGILIFIIGLIWGIKALARKLKKGNKKEPEKIIVNQEIKSNPAEIASQTQHQQHQSKPAEQPQTPQKTPQSQGKGNNRMVIIIIAVVVVLGASGYLFSQFAARKTGEKIAEKIFETGTGGKVDIDTSNGGATFTDGNTSLSTGSSAQWPSNLPAGAPKYSGGKITSVTEANSSWSILMGETNRSQFDAYKSSLTQSGWISTGNAQVMIDTSQYQKNGWDLSISFDESSGATIITVLKSLQ